MEIVTLRLFKGREAYDKNGKLISENQLYKTPPVGTVEWTKMKANLKNLCNSVEIIAVHKQTSEIVYHEHGGKKIPNTLFSYSEVEISDVLRSEIDSIFKDNEKELTGDQKEIAELKAKLNELLSQKSEKVVKTETVVEPKKTIDTIEGQTFEEVCAEYQDLVGKKPFHAWTTIEKVREKIEEYKAIKQAN